MIAALALASCSGERASTGQGPQAASETAPTQGPLDAYLASLWVDEAESQEANDARQIRTEELIAACMAAEGFDYTPNKATSSTVSLPAGAGEDGPEDGSVAFAQTYGYGLSVMRPGTAVASPNEDYVDLNADYVASLTESEQAAYHTTLTGPEPTEAELAAIEAGTGTFDWSQGGCSGTAQQTVQDEMIGGWAAMEDPAFAELFAGIQNVSAEIYDEENPSPGLAKLIREWSDCMAKTEHSGYASPMAASQALLEEFNALHSNGESAPSAQDSEALAAREITVATADATCQETVDFAARRDKLGHEIQQTFLDAHKPELDAMLAKHALQKKG